MADNNRDLLGVKDRSNIDANDPAEVAYVHYQFPWLSLQEIKSAIKEHGPDRDAVIAFLESKSGTGKNIDE